MRNEGSGISLFGCSDLVSFISLIIFERSKGHLLRKELKENKCKIQALRLEGSISMLIQKQTNKTKQNKTVYGTICFVSLNKRKNKKEIGWCNNTVRLTVNLDFADQLNCEVCKNYI